MPVYSGYASIVAVLERLERDLLGAEVELLLDREAGGLERLRVDLAEDVLLGEVLRADGERLARVGRVLLDGLAAVGLRPTARRRRRAGAAGALVVVAARGDAPRREGEHGQQRQQGADGVLHGVSVLGGEGGEGAPARGPRSA